MRLKDEEWFLWRKKSDAKKPWDRQYLHTDFLKSEIKRWKDVESWKKRFNSTKIGAKVEEVSFYVLPIKLGRSWLRYCSLKEYVCKGLSAIKNCPIHTMVAFFPKNREPSDYSLIKIEDAKKYVILDGYSKSTIGHYSLIVESWEELPTDYIYRDIPHEPKIINEILGENISMDDYMIESVKSPLCSSPYVFGDKGGISFNSLLDSSSFAKVLERTMQMMVPPEYRSFEPSESVLKGKDIRIDNRIEIHVAEKIIRGNNFLKSFGSFEYNKMEHENKERSQFLGEYSVVGGLVKSESKGKQLHKDMIHHFFDSVISILNFL